LRPYASGLPTPPAHAVEVAVTENEPAPAATTFAAPEHAPAIETPTQASEGSSGETTEAESVDDAIVPVRRTLQLGPVDDAEQKLSEALIEARLVDADQLTNLLAEARRQRRSLRQVLLATSTVTLYQLALIEAGNLAALQLGPVRVLDRLRATPHEIVYRVFDPRRGHAAVLRHLSEAVLLDTDRLEEYRHQFTRAIMAEPHLAATLEVCEIQQRPAVLQELLVGLPATDWPPQASAPGVCFQLLFQAAQGLAALHRAGLVHGHISESVLLLTADGTLKICGGGEPAWLYATSEDEPDARTDLQALGRVVSGWCTPSGVRRGAKAKALPEALVSILYRLTADTEHGYRDAHELLVDLGRTATEIAANAEAWSRLLKYVSEHGSADAIYRQVA
jgi:serine/threonine protein kinase